MENYPSFSYPDSGDSSPNSREPDFENPPPSWDDQQPQLQPQPHQNRVKFMVSYNGKIQPRSYDNLLSYVGGDTKILAVDRNVKFSALLSKLASLITSLPDGQQGSATAVVSFKYQLPGEDLDALISVTNDDDLDHMMHEYDRLCKASSKPARLRLFLFSDRVFGSGFSSVSYEPGKVGPENEPDRTPKFVDAFAAINQHHQEQQQQHQQVNYLNQNDVVLEPPMTASPPPPMPMPVHNNVDFLFGLDNKVPVPVPVQVQVPGPVHAEPDLVHEMNRVQISAQEFHHLQQQPSAAVYSPTTEENPPSNFPSNIPAAAYWQQQQQQQQQQQFLQQQVYMMHAPPQANVYQQPAVMQPPAIGGQVQANQGYYQVQGMQPVYSMPPPMPAVSTAAQVRPGESAGAVGYAQVGYDSATGRQFYYAAAPPPFSGMTAGATAVGVVGDGRSCGDGKVVQNVSPSSGGV